MLGKLCGAGRKRAIIATVLRILKPPHIVEPIVWSDARGAQRIGGIVMTISTLGLTPRATTWNEGFDISKLRALIAEHLYVDVRHVTDDAHLSDDLGADWLDRLELIILVEEFAGVEITDDGDQIEVVGDLIHYIDNTGGGMASRNLSTAA